MSSSAVAQTTPSPTAASPRSTASPGTALYQPPDGLLYFGLWLDTTASSGDSPVAANARMGRNISCFQLAQTIPITSYDSVTGTGGTVNATLVYETLTNAAISVTVYPSQGLAAVTADDLSTLGVQLQAYIEAGHAVFLRFAPDMNINSSLYGVQPTLFKATWKALYSSIRTSCPTCSLVWSPQSSIGYPYGITFSDIPSAEDQAALDTNSDGMLDLNDDAYAPYYPGDAYVDWTGLSYHYEGNFPNDYNVVMPAGFFEGSMTGVLPAVPDIGQMQTQYTPFYNTYCTTNPCMISESGAAWKVNQTGIPDWLDGNSPTQVQVESTWVSAGISNVTFLDAYPKLGMIISSEWEKVETDGNVPTLRDYRLTNNTDVLASFLGQLDSVGWKYLWANASDPSSQEPQEPATPATSTTHANLAAIIGGAVGGFGCLCWGGTWLLCRRKKLAKAALPIRASIFVGEKGPNLGDATTSIGHAGQARETRLPEASIRLHNPKDASTFPRPGVHLSTVLPPTAQEDFHTPSNFADAENPFLSPMDGPSSTVPLPIVHAAKETTPFSYSGLPEISGPDPFERETTASSTSPVPPPTYATSPPGSRLTSPAPTYVTSEGGRSRAPTYKSTERAGKRRNK